jgi:hypothetical protein
MISPNKVIIGGGINFSNINGPVDKVYLLDLNENSVSEVLKLDQKCFTPSLPITYKPESISSLEFLVFTSCDEKVPSLCIYKLP